MENFVKLKELINSLGKDSKKFFENGNRTAGTRARKSLQEVKVLAQEIRNEITAIKKKDS